MTIARTFGPCATGFGVPASSRSAARRKAPRSRAGGEAEAQDQRVAGE
jgi:hypothetical protein